MLPRPGLRVYRAPAERTELRFSNSVVVGAGVGVGVGEPSETVSMGGGGLSEPGEKVALVTAAEAGESVVPLMASSVMWVFTVGGCSGLTGDPLLVGTSREAPRPVARRSAGLETLIGNRPFSDAPLERSRRCR